MAGESRRLPITLTAKATGPAILDPVTTLRRRLLSSGRVALEWTPVVGAEKYWVYRRLEHPIITAGDLEFARLVGEVETVCFEETRARRETCTMQWSRSMNMGIHRDWIPSRVGDARNRSAEEEE